MGGSHPEPGEGAGDLRSGQRIGKYQILRQLGQGGMATVYLATSSGPGGFAKTCALKVIRPELSERAETRRMLVQEARIAALLNHPHIVQVFDLGESGDHYYMAMEWVEGPPLNRLLAVLGRRDRTLSIGAVAAIGGAIAEALAYLEGGVSLDGERLSLVHRDVSPSNVLISSTGAVKLADFGIVKVQDGPTQTRAGVLKGKVAYMAPELLRGQPVDHRSDLFALGVVLFEALTLRRLFYRANMGATVTAITQGRVPAPSSLNPAVPPELDAIVLRALERDARDRFHHANELVQALAPLITSGARAELAELVQTSGLIHEGPHTPPPEPSSLPSVSLDPGLSLDVEVAFDDPHGSDRTVAADELPHFEADTVRPDDLPPRRPPISRHGNAALPSDHALLFGASSELETGSNLRDWAPAIIVASALLATAVFWWVVLA